MSKPSPKTPFPKPPTKAELTRKLAEAQKQIADIHAKAEKPPESTTVAPPIVPTPEKVEIDPRPLHVRYSEACEVLQPRKPKMTSDESRERHIIEAHTHAKHDTAKRLAIDNSQTVS